jgi:hypothetical protein
VVKTLLEEKNFAGASLSLWITGQFLFCLPCKAKVSQLSFVIFAGLRCGYIGNTVLEIIKRFLKNLTPKSVHYICVFHSEVAAFCVYTRVLTSYRNVMSRNKPVSLSHIPNTVTLLSQKN